GMSSGGMSSGGTSSGGMSTSGTGGTGSDNPYPPSWDTLKLVLSGTNPPCTASDCHGNGGPNVLWFPKNDDATLWRYLSTHVSIQCGNMPVVDPGHPEHSALIKILKGPCVGPCGITPRMPKDCEDSNPPNCLEDDAVEALEQWITLGAPHP
ncbi:MAG TPA: hypothetical protein VNN72_16515, partial [Polyangiaceae bacterium]|nr:hypothetical protein [Polyangiaceae bacterium]